jgi:putative ABC transport system permease protein
MRFIFQMARREIRSAWRRLLFFFLCIGIGVGSIVALRSTIQNLNIAVAGEARQLLTADVQIDTGRPWSADTIRTIDRIARPPRVEARVETVEAATMVRPAEAAHEGAMMIELKGIEPPFPLFGALTLASGDRFDYSLLADDGAVVAPLLLERLRLNMGDRIKIGERVFTIRGTLGSEPGGGGFRLGPRVFIERAALERAGLTEFGSRARRRILLRVQAGAAESLARELRAALKNSFVNVRTYKDSQESLSEQFSRAENYLSLAGLVVLVLGGIGIASVTRVFIEQKKKTIAILKCLGGTGRRITGVYLAQIIALGLAGSVLGIALAKLALLVTEKYFSASLPPAMTYALQPGAVAQGIGLGLLISVLFSALPLLRIRHIKPNMLLRDETSEGRGWTDILRWATGGLALLGLLLLVSWQAGSLRVGFFFLAGLAITAGGLYLAARLLIFIVRRARHISSFPLRQAINNLYRPGNQTTVIVMGVGLGAFLVIAVQTLQSNLIREFDRTRGGGLPNMFLIDIQPDQEAGVKELIEKATGERPVLVPTVRARIAAVNGREMGADQGEMRRERGRLGREFVVTYRPHLESNETIIAGQFWDPTPSSEAEVSIEEGLRGAAGLDLGSTITFDILGRRLTARVTSIRRVDWRNSRTGFMILFRPGVLESAPQTLIGAINGPTGALEKSRFQRALLDQYPNISVIDVEEIVRVFEKIVNNVTLAVSFIGGFVFLSGALILIGSIAMTKFQRIYEAAILKTLGARRKVLLAILFAEYGLLGTAAGLVGSMAAAGLSYAVARFVLNIPWSLTPAHYLAGIAATALLVTAVGALSSLDVISRKPLAVLRSQ